MVSWCIHIIGFNKLTLWFDLLLKGLDIVNKSNTIECSAAVIFKFKHARLISAPVYTNVRAMYVMVCNVELRSIAYSKCDKRCRDVPLLQDLTSWFDLLLNI